MWPVSTRYKFWRRVSREAGCWLWLAGKTKQGYGRFKYNGYDRVMAHRFSWEIHNGTIPDGLFVLHKCDNPPCVRPDHLFLGTKRDNIDDAISKGRWGGPVPGSAHPFARLTEDAVLEIRRRLAAGEYGRDLAREFAVGEMTISDIRRRKTWAHLIDASETNA